MSTKKQLWKQILKGKYAVEKSVDCKPHPHVLKKIGDFQTTLQYINALKQAYDADEVNNSDSILSLLKLPKLLINLGFNDKDTEIYFGYMTDKYWYPQDCSEEEAIRQYWFDTVVVRCSDETKLKLLIKRVSRMADEVDLVEFPTMRHVGKGEALRLWWD